MQSQEKKNPEGRLLFRFERNRHVRSRFESDMRRQKLSYSMYYLAMDLELILITALANSRANAFTLLDTKYARKISIFLNNPMETLERPVPVKGYNGQVGKPITSVLRIHLRVNGRRQYNVPFLVTDLENHDAIISRKGLAYLNIWLNVRNQQLIWPKNLPPTPCFIKETTVDIKTHLQSTVDPTH